MRLSNHFPRSTVLIVAVMTAVLALPARAEATNWAGATGVTGCQGNNQADDAAHTFAYATIRGDTYDAAQYARLNVYEPIAGLSTSVQSETIYTDAIIRDENYSTTCGVPWHPQPGGAVGRTTCNKIVGPSYPACDSSVVRIDLSYMDLASTSTGNKRGILTHEVGHSWGLLHRSEYGAMIPTVPVPAFLTSHDINVHLIPEF